MIMSWMEREKKEEKHRKVLRKLRLRNEILGMNLIVFVFTSFWMAWLLIQHGIFYTFPPDFSNLKSVSPMAYIFSMCGLMIGMLIMHSMLHEIHNPQNIDEEIEEDIDDIIDAEG